MACVSPPRDVDERPGGERHIVFSVNATNPVLHSHLMSARARGNKNDTDVRSESQTSAPNTLYFLSGKVRGVRSLGEV